MARKAKQTDELPLPQSREKLGPTERAAQGDLRELRRLDMLTTGTSALTVAYRLAARDVDRAERKSDAWAAASAMRELRALRLEIAPTAAPLAGDGLGELLGDIADVIRAARAENP